MMEWNKLLDDPSTALDDQKLDELELLLGGLFAPADGYVLPGSAPPKWPVGIPLVVSESTRQAAVRAGVVQLTDRDGTPLARLTVTGSRPKDGASGYLSGPVTRLQSCEHPPFRDLRIKGPFEGFPGNEGTSIVVAAFSRVPEAVELAEAISRAEALSADLWLIAVADRQNDDEDTVRATMTGLQRCAELLPGVRAGLLFVPGRTDPICASGITRGRYVLDCLGAGVVLDFSAIAPGAISSAAATSPPERDRASPEREPRQEAGLVVFFTGFSGSGKSTLARSLAERLHHLDHRAVIMLDGDHVRRNLSTELGFSREDREINVQRIGWVASLVSRAGGIAICAPIAPFEATRQSARSMAEAAGVFLLVHVSTALEVCEQRDRKGLYAKARAGLVKDFTGIDSPYENPTEPDLVIDTVTMSIDDGVNAILGLISK